VICKNGRPTLTEDQDRRLFAESAAACLLCNGTLFPEDPKRKRSLSIAERAHIVSHSDAGPRANRNSTDQERADPANIILVCPTCHTIIDKVPDEYPTEELIRLKEVRRRAVLSVGGSPICDDRSTARAAAERLLDRNRILFEQKGPHAGDGSVASSEAADGWTRVVLEEIIPNSRLLLAMVEVNADLTTSDDRHAAVLLRQHVDALERKHRQGVAIDFAPRFPDEANLLFKDE
jgi:hypothetical protein